MTRTDALRAMKEGKRVQHMYFTNGEYLRMEDGLMFNQSGDRYESTWNDKQGEPWDKHWNLYKRVG